MNLHPGACKTKELGIYILGSGVTLMGSHESLGTRSLTKLLPETIKGIPWWIPDCPWSKLVGSCEVRTRKVLLVSANRTEPNLVPSRFWTQLQTAFLWGW